MADRGIRVTHTTILRWAQRYLPEFEKRWRKPCFYCDSEFSSYFSLEENMKINSAIVRSLALVAIAFLASCGTTPTADTTPAPAARTQPLQLIQRIPVPGVTGRIDHFTAYPKRRLLIFAGLGNNSVEIVNTFEAKVVHSIKGLNEPQGVLYVPEFDKIFVANAGSGMVNVYDGKTYALRKSI
jgi:DNA-binding beta-propeller fold protein YncE